MIFERAPEDTLQPIGQGFFGADFLLKKIGGRITYKFTVQPINHI